MSLKSYPSIPLEQIYEVTFIKELYHLYYDYIGLKNLTHDYNDSLYRKDYISSLLKESLTLYYIKKYCEKYNLSDFLLKAADLISPIYHPGACYYLINDLTYDDIFKKSFYSKEAALKSLFINNSDLYYKIINKDSNSTILPYYIPSENSLDILIQYESYLIKNNRSNTIILFYIRTVKSLFTEYLKINCNILSFMNFNSKMNLINLLINQIEQKKILFKHRAAINSFKKFIISSKD